MAITGLGSGIQGFVQGAMEAVKLFMAYDQMKAQQAQQQWDNEYKSKLFNIEQQKADREQAKYLQEVEKQNRIREILGQMQPQTITETVQTPTNTIQSFRNIEAGTQAPSINQQERLAAYATKGDIPNDVLSNYIANIQEGSALPTQYDTQTITKTVQGKSREEVLNDLITVDPELAMKVQEGLAKADMYKSLMNKNVAYSDYLGQKGDALSDRLDLDKQKWDEKMALEKQKLALKQMEIEQKYSYLKGKEALMKHGSKAAQTDDYKNAIDGLRSQYQVWKGIATSNPYNESLKSLANQKMQEIWQQINELTTYKVNTVRNQQSQQQGNKSGNYFDKFLNKK